MLDTVLLRLVKNRKTFNQLYGVIPKEGKTVDAQTLALLADFDKYFEAFPSHATIDRETFLPRFAAWHPTLKPEQLVFFHKILDGVFDKDADEDQRKNIMQWLAEIELATGFANLVEDHNQGDLDDAFSRATAVLDQYRKRLEVKFDQWIDDDIRTLLQEDMHDEGLSWRLTCLNNATRKLRGGDFGIIAARPDKGKTSFLASEVTWMATQLPADRNVLWLNNEGPGRKIVKRLYQAAVDMTVPQMGAIAESGELEKKYIQAVGRRDRIRVMDIHGKTNGQVEMMIEDNNAGLVLFDMIDNIHGFGDAARTDLALEKMYQWARERCVKYDCVGLATSQISNDGDGLMYPTMGMLKDSKTGKQGACDFQLMIGASNDPGFARSRFLSLPKNKIRRPGSADCKQEVYFDIDTGRYRDVPGTGLDQTQIAGLVNTPKVQEPSQGATAEELDALMGS